MIGLDLQNDRPDIDLCLDAFSLALPAGDVFAQVGPEATNILSGYWHSLRKDSPGKVWWDADYMHPAIARALKIDPADSAAIYALAPFRLTRINGKAMILAAFPAPCILGPVDRDWLSIETVIAWDPLTDTASVLGSDEKDHLIGHFPTDAETATIYGSPFQFFRALAEARAQFAIQRNAVNGAWFVKPVERDLTNGMLLIGSPEKVRWPIFTMPADAEVIQADATAINRAMLKQARIPRARPAPTNIRRAA